VWSHVDLALRAGEFTAVLGPNGAGKSTLIDVLLGLLPLAAGQAVVLGEPPGRGNAEIGFLPQRRSFDAAARIRGREVVRLGVDGDRWGFPLPFPGERSRAAARRVDEVIELVGAGAYADRPLGELSGGEQQRLLIAQALARRPRLLLLDEPLDSLDLANQRAVAALVQRICREQDVAVVLVAHDVNPLIGALDQVVYLAGGSAVCGAPEDVITSETLSRLYGVPVDVLRTRDGRLVVAGTPDAHAHHPSHGH
jgi:zinc/manganese transport system ATP-binding protein